MRLSRRAQRVAAVTLYALAAIILLKATTEMYAFSNDFVQDYASGVLLRNGRPIYGAEFSAFARELLHRPYFQNYHPPFDALFVSVFTFLPFPFTYGLLVLVSIVSLIFVLYLLLPKHCTDGAIKHLILAMFLCWYPVWIGIAFGAFSLFMLACLVAGYRIMLTRRNEIWSSILYALPCALKLYPLLVIPFLVFHRRFRIALFVLLFTLAFSVLPETFSPGCLKDYFSEVMWTNGALFRHQTLNLGITPFFAKIFGGTLGVEQKLVIEPLYRSATLLTLAPLAGLCVAICYFLKLFRISYFAGDAGCFHSFALTLCSTILLSPVSWAHGLVMLLPAYALMFSSNEPVSSWTWLIFIGSLLLGFLPDVYVVSAVMSAASKPPYWSGLIFLASTGTFSAFSVWVWLCLHRAPGEGQSRNRSGAKTIYSAALEQAGR